MLTLFLSFNIFLFFPGVLSECLVDGTADPCSLHTTETACLADATHTCMFLAGCCNADICNYSINLLLANADIDLSAFSSFGIDSVCVDKMACAQVNYCKYDNDKNRCVLSECYANSPETCPSGNCVSGTCPIGKIYPDGTNCCNPTAVGALPNCYNGGTNTWENCSNTNGCAFYSGGCYPDACLNIPKQISVKPSVCGKPAVLDSLVPKFDVPTDSVGQFCVLKEDNRFHQSRCFSLPSGHCYYNTPGCYYEPNVCPLNVLSGATTQGCCAPEAAGQDSSECAAKATADACTAVTNAACVWAVPRNKCLLNPCKATGQANCKEEDGCKWVAPSGTAGQCYPSLYDPLDPLKDPTFPPPSRAHPLPLPPVSLALLLALTLGAGVLLG